MRPRSAEASHREGWGIALRFACGLRHSATWRRRVSALHVFSLCIRPLYAANALGSERTARVSIENSCCHEAHRSRPQCSMFNLNLCLDGAMKCKDFPGRMYGPLLPSSRVQTERALCAGNKLMEVSTLFTPAFERRRVIYSSGRHMGILRLVAMSICLVNVPTLRRA